MIRLSLGDMESILRRSLYRSRWEPEKAFRLSEVDWQKYQSEKISVAVFGSTSYPKPLTEIPDPPFLLFYRGKDLGFFKHPVAIVGTRYPTKAAEEATYNLSSELAQAGCGVISGLAFGIDRQAHRGALEKGKTWAVLACGPERIYPAAHQKLGMDILESGGVLLSEYPPGTPALTHHFPLRNRIISGLSRSVVVVQAPRKSGALITAQYAIEHNRDLYVHEAGFHPDRGFGGQDLADQGATVIHDASEILQQGETPWII